MAGVVLQVVPKRVLDFSNLASGTTQDLVLAQGIDISQYSEVSLMVRVHDNSGTWPSLGTPKIEIFGQTDGRTFEDPGLLFAGSTLLGTATVASGTAQAAYFVNSLGSNVGSMVRIVARGTRGGATNTVKATLSVDISAKTA